ncbi:MAG: HEAT repeat domain-containing protein [candidate division Zixibacteria bacterium]|nr:HEAT repeat domain-containing protein [candidate division Zixibacteria bacterium]
MDEVEFQPEIEEFDQKEFDSAKSLVQLLVKALKSLLLYPENNPIPKEFKRKLQQNFYDFLDSNEELRLEVKHSQLLYQGRMVYEDQDREEGIAYALHRDGVRELIFIKGLEHEELTHFLEALELCLKSTDLEDDLVTLLWEKDFDHIKYLVVDDLLDVDVPNAEDVPDDWDFNRLLYSEIALSGEEKLSPEQKASKDLAFRQKEEQTKELSKKLKEFSPEEIKNIHQLLKSDARSRLLDDFFILLGEILITEKDFLEFDKLVERIEKILDWLIGVADFDSATKIIWRVRRFERAARDSSPQVDSGSLEKTERIKKVIDQAGEEEKIRRVGSVLNEKEVIDLSKVKEYLLSLNWNSVSPILHMLRDLKYSPARKMVCEVLEEVGKDHIGVVGEGVYDSLWYVARNVAFVLGRIGKEEGVKFLKNIIKHSDLRVRKEVITSLTKIGGKESQALLVSALDDEDKPIRILASRGLARRKEKEALSALMKIIQSDEFIDALSDEKRQMLESLALIGEDEVVPFLKKLVNKRRWLKKDKHNETRIFAIRALGFIKTQKASQTLKELSEKRNKVIRQACQYALRKMGSQLA